MVYLRGQFLGPIIFLLYTSDIPKLVKQSGLNCHLYADDTQLYGYTNPDAASIQLLRQTSTSCIAGISDWIKSNRLQLNSSKTDYLWCSSL